MPATATQNPPSSEPLYDGLTREQFESRVNNAIESKEVLRSVFASVKVRDAELNEDGKPRAIVAVINTDEVDRYWSIVDPAGGEFDNFLKNPVLLWMHGFDFCGSWVVGRVLSITRSKSEIEVELEFDLEDAIGAELDRKYRQGWLRGFSIGFIPVSAAWEMHDGKEILRYTKWELVELSAVAVPANASALKRALAEGEVGFSVEALRRCFEARLKGDITEDEQLELRAALEPVYQRVVAGEKVLPDSPMDEDGQDEVEVEVDLDLNQPNGRQAKTPKPNRRSSAKQTRASRGSRNRFDGVQPPKIEGPERSIRQEVDDDDDSDEGFPVDFEGDWDLRRELRAATPEEREAMSCLTLDVVNGEGEASVRHIAVHHHSDGTISWGGLASCMARLLTQPAALKRSQLEAIYRHLADHYEEIGIEPPTPGAKSEEEAYDLALEGRIAWIDEDDNEWLFVEPVKRNGRYYPGFQRVDDSSQLCLGPLPALGRLHDHRKWGKRKAVELQYDERLISELASVQRELEELRESRAGKEFSKKNRARLQAMVSALEDTAKELTVQAKDLRSTASDIRAMLGEESEPPGEEKGVGDRETRDDSDPEPLDDEDDDDVTDTWLRKIVSSAISGR